MRLSTYTISSNALAGIILLNASVARAQSGPTPSPSGSAAPTAPSAPTTPIPAAPTAAPTATPTAAPTATPTAAPTPSAKAPAGDGSSVDTKLSSALEKADVAVSSAKAGAIDKARALQQASEKDLTDAESLSAKNLDATKKVAAAKLTIRARSELVDEISAAVCGAGGKRPGCFFYGIIVASGSLTTITVGGQHGGVTARSVAAAAIPTLGYRLMLDKNGRFNADFGLLSMLVSKDLASLFDRKGCSSSDAAFENLLPCAGNATTIPVFGAFAGITAGTTDVGIVTLMLNGGLAKTSLDASIHAYGGLTVGLVNFSKFLNY